MAEQRRKGQFDPLLNKPVTSHKGFIGSDAFLKLKQQMLAKRQCEEEKKKAEAQTQKLKNRQERLRKEKEHQDQLFEALMSGIQLPKEPKKCELTLMEARQGTFSSVQGETPLV